MRNRLVRILLTVFLAVIVTGLYRENSLLRTQISILKQTPVRANTTDSGPTISAQSGVPEH